MKFFIKRGAFGDPHNLGLIIAGKDRVAVDRTIAEIINQHREWKLKIDKNRCIQCLCCLEVCQKGALIRICSGVRKIMGKGYYYGKKV